MNSMSEDSVNSKNNLKKKKENVQQDEVFEKKATADEQSLEEN